MILPLHAYEAFRHVRLTASTSLFTSQVTEIRMSDTIPSPPLAYSPSGYNTSHHVVSIRLSGVCLQQEAGDVLSRYDGLVDICLFAIFLASSPYICHFCGLLKHRSCSISRFRPLPSTQPPPSSNNLSFMNVGNPIGV